MTVGGTEPFVPRVKPPRATLLLRCLSIAIRSCDLRTPGRMALPTIEEFVKPVHGTIDLLLAHRGVGSCGREWRVGRRCESLQRLAAGVGRAANADHFQPVAVKTPLRPTIHGADMDTLAIIGAGNSFGTSRKEISCSFPMSITALFHGNQSAFFQRGSDVVSLLLGTIKVNGIIECYGILCYTPGTRRSCKAITATIFPWVELYQSSPRAGHPSRGVGVNIRERRACWRRY